MWQKIRNYLSEGNRASWFVFVFFSLAIFLKGMIFHWNSFHTILISTLWHNPLEFIRFWGGKIVPAILLGSFVFLSKRKYWTIIVLALLDVWIIANIFYFNANGLYLSYETMQMADNMSGFLDSLYSYTEPSMILYPLITLIYGVAIYLLPKMKKRLPIHFGIALLISICMSIIGTICYHFYVKSWHSENPIAQQVNDKMLKGEDFHYYFPFGHVYYFAAIEDNVEYLCGRRVLPDGYLSDFVMCERGAYFWRGFGVNLFDSAAIENREVPEEKAFMISEKLIRSNYFWKKR